MSKVKARCLAIGGTATIITGVVLAKIPFFVHGYDRAYGRMALLTAAAFVVWARRARAVAS